MKILDNAAAVRVVYLLTLPFIKWEAFAEGIIDADGTLIQPGADSPNWTMLHRLVARLKIIMGKVPGGKSQIASIAAAYLLVKECVLSHNEADNLQELFDNSLNYKLDFHTYCVVTDLIKLSEDGEVAPANSIENVAGIKPGDEPPGKKKKTKLIVRK